MGTASLSSSSFFPFLSFLLSRGGEENGEAIGWCWGRREGIGMVEEEEEELGLEERRGGEGWGGEEEGGKVGDREDKNNHPRHKLRLLSAGQTLSNFPSLCFRFLLSSLSSSQSSSSSLPPSFVLILSSPFAPPPHSPPSAPSSCFPSCIHFHGIFFIIL